MRPTFFNSPWPAMPVISVPRISGATITLMRRRKMSLRTRRCAANCGQSRPISSPSSMAKKIQYVRERRSNPARARKSKPIQLIARKEVCPCQMAIIREPMAKNNKPAIRSSVKTLEFPLNKIWSSVPEFMACRWPHHISRLERKNSRSLQIRAQRNLPHGWPRCYLAVMPIISHLECSRCHATASPEKPQTVCTQCAGSLYVRYDLSPLRGLAARQEISREDPGTAWRGMWRYRSVLPEAVPVTLGEGWTPVIRSRRYPNAFLKEEGANPTGSFKARGLAMAVTMARHYGLKKLAVPSAGNAAGALAAYAAAAGIEADIFMPRDVPFANYVEAVAYGANVTLVNGLISDCGRMVAERKEKEGWFDISSLKEPFRVEGKKTMGYELCEQLGWDYPDAVFYPTGGGVGLIGMWKAFGEMEELGWVRPGKRPRMIAVQSAGCAPMVRAFEQHAGASEAWQNAATFAAGLRVPKPYGDSIMLEILRDSAGIAVAVPDETILASLKGWARHEGIFLSPEGAAATAAYDQLIASGFLKAEDRVVIFNTGAGLKYTDMTAEAMHITRPSPAS